MLRAAGAAVAALVDHDELPQGRGRGEREAGAAEAPQDFEVRRTVRTPRRESHRPGVRAGRNAVRVEGGQAIVRDTELRGERRRCRHSAAVKRIRQQRVKSVKRCGGSCKGHGRGWAQFSERFATKERERKRDISFCPGVQAGASTPSIIEDTPVDSILSAFWKPGPTPLFARKQGEACSGSVACSAGIGSSKRSGW